MPVQGGRNAECQVVFFGSEATDGQFSGTATYLGGWDLDGDGEPGDCTEVVPTTTTTAPTATTTSPPPTASPATLPATGNGGTTPAVAAAVLGVLAGGVLVLTIRRRRA